MKTSICPKCYWFNRQDDPFFEPKTVCDCLGKELNDITITQCKYYKEVEQ